MIDCSGRRPKRSHLGLNPKPLKLIEMKQILDLDYRDVLTPEFSDSWPRVSRFLDTILFLTPLFSKAFCLVTAGVIVASGSGVKYNGLRAILKWTPKRGSETTLSLDPPRVKFLLREAWHGGGVSYSHVFFFFLFFSRFLCFVQNSRPTFVS